MADTLAAKSCTPCKGGIPPLTSQQAESLHRQVPGWELRDDAHRIERKFKSSATSVRRCASLGESASC